MLMYIIALSFNELKKPDDFENFQAWTFALNLIALAQCIFWVGIFYYQARVADPKVLRSGSNVAAAAPAANRESGNHPLLNRLSVSEQAVE